MNASRLGKVEQKVDHLVRLSYYTIAQLHVSEREFY